MDDKQLNRELNPAPPSVVPQRFTPRPEQFQKPATQELRNEQSRLTQGYALERINYLENQRHMSPYKRDAQWRHMLMDAEGNEVGIGYNQSAFDAKLDQAIRDAKTARVVMLDKISEWAGNLNRDQMAEALPQIWKSFLPSVEQEVPEPSEDGEEVALVEEVEPIQVITRPDDVDFASMPKSEVVAPEQLSLGDILGRIEKDNSKD